MCVCVCVQMTPIFFHILPILHDDLPILFDAVEPLKFKLYCKGKQSHSSIISYNC